MFKYKDEEDKSLGITGMVISLNIYDQEEMLLEVTLDNEDGPSITFTPDFYFYSNPRLSAKIAWNEMLRQYQLMTGLVLGNVMCRSIVRQHKPLSKESVDAVRDFVAQEGIDNCSLDKDEVDIIFEKTYNNLSRIYSNRQVTVLADSIAKALRQRRTMSGNDVMELIAMLRR